MTTWLDELRIVKGQAAWTSGFTPPTLPYTIGGDVAAFTGQNPAATQTTLTAAAGSYTITGASAALALGLTAGTGAYTLTGSPAGLVTVTNIVLTAAGGSYSVTGSPATFRLGLAAATGSYTVTGASAALNLGLATAAGSYVITGTAATLKLGLTAGTGSYTLTGASAALKLGYAAGSGSYTLTGTAALLRIGFIFPVGGSTDGGQYGIVPWTDGLGQSVTFVVDKAPLDVVLAADATSYVLAGTDATLKVSTSLTAAGGSYTITGATAALKLGLTAGTGSYTVTGATLALRLGIIAGGGSYTVTGSPAGLPATANFVLPAAAGAYTLTGQDAAFVTGGATVLAASTGAYTLTGTPAALTVGNNVVLTAAAGSYTLTGATVALRRGLTAGAGAYTVTGATANFVTSGNVILTAGAGAYGLTGTAAILAVTTFVTAKLVTSFTPSSNRNDLTILVGVRFALTVDTPFNGIGLRCGLNNTGAHTVGLYDYVTNTLLRSANVDLTGKTEGTFYYADIAPITLVAGTIYAVMALVTGGDGQQWSDYGPTTLKDAEVGSVAACYSFPPGTAIVTTVGNTQYHGVDLSYSVAAPDAGRPVGVGGTWVDYGREKRRKARGLRQAEKFFEKIKADAEEKKRKLEVVATKATKEVPGEDTAAIAAALAQQQRQQQVIDAMLAQAAARVAQAKQELAQLEAMQRAMDDMDEEDAITVLLLQ